MTKNTDNRGFVPRQTPRIAIFLWRTYADICWCLRSLYRLLHSYRIVFISYDEKGPYIIIKGEIVRLVMSDAQPLMGIQIEDRYFTTIESKKACLVEDDDF